ncbi:ABC transporter permease [Criibacterium bergeronii]|uniref:ABC transporter permease n=1 Tax=Criibacterium bergeronii TaxID=1871336 RepID=A0A371IKL3_9FIRM|nr:ABC transporter permease [Criibacterium bergeronii]MBS6062823.1 ABC transporter permease [Peptostreptococcaceae bacterium]RDY20990.1 ABC transporter permease [Criibacterium bergeronii]TRW27707.1 ABC transporter permease [Criibacterium bergeronii]
MIRQFLEYYATNGAYVFEQFVRHFLISIYGVLFASMVAIPIGFYISRKYNLSQIVISLANILQTIPSLAMVSILMIVMGLGVNTVIMAVFLYSLLPIIKNTYTGVRNVDKNLVDVAKAMGMTKLQVIFKIELPLSISIIMAGVRNALVMAIGVTAIGTFIGAGGLGDIITRGINVSNGSAIILAGALPTALMAVISDIVLQRIEKLLDPLK